jgi:putative O-acetyl transferase related protein
MVLKQRINWIDWAKVFAIYLVVLGHLLSKTGREGYIFNFIYSFHMPFFFFISGYLFTIKENNFRSFLKGSIRSLLVPYVLLNLIGNFFLIPTWVLAKQWPLDQLFYFITADGRGEPGPTWFLVCLFQVRLLSYFIVRQTSVWRLLVVSFCILIAYLFPFHLYWRIDTVFMVIPFYIAGYELKSKLSFFSSKISFFILLLIVLLLTMIMGYSNVYLRLFGNYPLLYYPYAFAGIFMLISLSFMFDKYNFKFITILSIGTIVIMALHGIMFLYVKTFFRIVHFDFIFLTTIGKFILSGIVLLLLYYPIIWLHKYFPMAIGRR